MSWMRKNYNPKMHTLFTPINIEKYKGSTPLVMRSKYEHQFAVWCDAHPSILMWSSETIAVPYYNPVKKRKANYYPDFIIKMQTIEGNKVFVIELKPESQTKSPKYSKRKSMLNEQLTYSVNIAKWQACKSYCEIYGYTFIVINNESLKNKR